MEKQFHLLKVLSLHNYALHNCYGYSPDQLVFGKNQNYPSVLIDNAPALEGQATNELIANYKNAMHTSHSACIDTVASKKLRRAIKSKTRSSTTLIQNNLLCIRLFINFACWMTN